MAYYSSQTSNESQMFNESPSIPSKATLIAAAGAAALGVIAYMRSRA